MDNSKRILIISIALLLFLNFKWFDFIGFSNMFFGFIIGSIVFNVITRKNKLFFGLIIYFYIWLFWGNLTFNIFTLIWDIGGDLILVNELYSIFIFTFSFLGFVFVKRPLIPNLNNSNLNFNFSLKKSVFLVKILIIFHLVLFLPNISFGIKENYTDFSQNIAFRIPFISRLIYIYPIFLILSYFQLQIGEKKILSFIFKLFFTSIVLSITGSRFILLTSVVSLLIIHYIFVLRTNKKFDKRIIIFGLLIFSIIYFVIPMLRVGLSQDLEKPIFSNEFYNVFIKFGGEYRDGVWSTIALSDNSKEIISSNYLQTLFYPLFPKPLISLLGLDYSVVFEKTSSVIMANSINVDVKGIRIGGVLELFYWKGYFGVVLGAILVFFISNFAIKILYRTKSIIFIIISSNILILPLYFMFAQSNLLFTPLISFIMLFVIIIYLSKKRNEKSVIYQ